MSSSVTYIVDDQDGSIEYLCPMGKNFLLSSSSPYYHRTWTTISSASCGRRWFKHTFNGTGISIDSHLSSPGNNFGVVIDEAERDIEPFSRGQFEIDGLDDGEHTVVYSVGDSDLQPVFDYLTVRAGRSTSLLGRDIIVDDNETGYLRYTGDWLSTAPEPLSFYSVMSPYKNPGHWSNTVGDTVEMTFFGSEVSVYGIMLPETTGADVITSYTIDGFPFVVPLPPRVPTNQSTPMVRLFRSALMPGRHHLVVNVTGVASSSDYLGIDFISYKSSEDSIETVQSVSAVSSTGGGNGRPVGAIAGAVVGGVVFFALIALLFYMLRKRKMQKKTQTNRFVITKLENGSLESLESNDVKKPQSLTPAYLPPMLSKT